MATATPASQTKSDAPPTPSDATDTDEVMPLKTIERPKGVSATGRKDSLQEIIMENRYEEENVSLDEETIKVSDKKAKCQRMDTLTKIISDNDPELGEDVDDDSWMDQWVVDEPSKKVSKESSQLASSKAADKTKDSTTSSDRVIPEKSDIKAQSTETKKQESTKAQAGAPATTKDTKVESVEKATSKSMPAKTDVDKSQTGKNKTEKENSSRGTDKPQLDTSKSNKGTTAQDQKVSEKKSRKSMEELAASTNALLESAGKRFPELAEKKSTKDQALESTDMNKAQIQNLLLMLRKEVTSIQTQMFELNNRLRATSEVLQETLAYVKNM